MADRETDVLTPSHVERLALKLVVTAGPDLGKELVLDKGTYMVGTGKDSDWILTDPAVSSTHLVVEVLPAGIKLVDNDSTNGSFFEGSRFTQLEPRPGSTVKIGRTELRVALAEERLEKLEPSPRTRFGGLVGQSVVMRRTFALLERIAGSDADVLIHGETGTGKEVCAEAIHSEGRRKTGPFVVADLAAVAPSLIESELFGHVRGAFTGASTDRAGVFEAADGGTLFLDEVGELPLELQPRLLRAIENRQIKRVGASTFKTVDVRVVAATHRDLRAEVAAKRFREDLYHRLAVVLVRLPPLRERREDIPPLVEHVLEQLGRPSSELSPRIRAVFDSYAWPGNVRELRNVVERAVSVGQDALPHETAASTPVTKGSVRADRPFKEVKEELVSAFEREYLADLLQRADGNITQAARDAGIDRAYLYRLLKKHGLAT